VAAEKLSQATLTPTAGTQMLVADMQDKVRRAAAHQLRLTLLRVVSGSIGIAVDAWRKQCQSHLLRTQLLSYTT